MGFSVDDFNDLLDNLSAQAAPWVTAFTGTPVVPLPASQGQAAAQQLQLQQQAQANLNKANPTLAGTLSNPTIVLLLFGVLVVIVLFLALRR
jgi:hypothetical protein